MATVILSLTAGLALHVPAVLLGGLMVPWAALRRASPLVCFGALAALAGAGAYVAVPASDPSHDALVRLLSRAAARLVLVGLLAWRLGLLLAMGRAVRRSGAWVTRRRRLWRAASRAAPHGADSAAPPSAGSERGPAAGAR